MNGNGKRSRALRPGIVIGIGLGGFVDGIVLHQILQWHHLVSENYPPNSVQNLQINTLADGIFHAATWVFTAIGLFWLWRVLQDHNGYLSRRVLFGALLMGWGLFNLVEGIIDHHILQIHHVRPGPDQTLWDIGFLVFGALLMVVGWLLTRAEASRATTTLDDRAV